MMNTLLSLRMLIVLMLASQVKTKLNIQTWRLNHVINIVTFQLPFQKYTLAHRPTTTKKHNTQVRTRERWEFK